MARKQEETAPPPMDAARDDPDSELLPAAPKVPWLHTFFARVVYYLTFAGAALAFVRIYTSVSRMQKGRIPVSPETVASTLSWAVALGALLFVLTLYTYENLRWRGQLARRSALFEKVLMRGREPEA